MCRACGASSVRRRADVTRGGQLTRFLAWLTGGATQRILDGGSGRTFRHQHAWCWNVEPVIEVTGEIYDEVQVDGTYLDDGWCLLTAVNGHGEVIGRQWCNRESTAAYKALLAPIPPPAVVVCDGGQGLLTALKDVWPSTAVQRCLVHYPDVVVMPMFVVFVLVMVGFVADCSA